MSNYVPGRALVGEPTPQTQPELFTSDDVRKEGEYLVKLQKRYGKNPVRSQAIRALADVLKARGEA